MNRYVGRGKINRGIPCNQEHAGVLGILEANK